MHSESVAQQTAWKRLEDCLATTYLLDDSQIANILKHLSDLKDAALIEAFISLSNNLTFIPFDQQQLRSLPPDDAVLAAPASHRILFENEFFRILDVSVQPGETDPFHKHQWSSIIIITQGSRFRVEDSLGKIREEEWGPMVEKFPGDKTSTSYTNIGSKEFKAIAFEIKE